MPISLAKRFKGHEAEIVRDIRLHGPVGAMMRWGAADYVAWEKLIMPWCKALGAKSGASEGSNLPAVPAAAENALVIGAGWSGLSSGSKGLAEELVDAFTAKVVRLQSENERLKVQLESVERELEAYKCRSDEKLADKVLSALELMK